MNQPMQAQRLQEAADVVVNSLYVPIKSPEFCKLVPGETVGSEVINATDQSIRDEMAFALELAVHRPTLEPCIRADAPEPATLVYHGHYATHEQHFLCYAEIAIAILGKRLHAVANMLDIWDRREEFLGSPREVKRLADWLEQDVSSYTVFVDQIKPDWFRVKLKRELQDFTARIVQDSSNSSELDLRDQVPEKNAGFEEGGGATEPPPVFDAANKNWIMASDLAKLLGMNSKQMNDLRKAASVNAVDKHGKWGVDAIGTFRRNVHSRFAAYHLPTLKPLYRSRYEHSKNDDP